MSLNVPIDYNTTDPNVWAAALEDALPMMYPATGQDLSGWFAAAIETGRRNPAVSFPLLVPGTLDPLAWGKGLAAELQTGTPNLVDWFARAIEAGRWDRLPRPGHGGIQG